MSALDDLTVCVTNFKRGDYLKRAIESVRAAGVRRVAVASVCPTDEVWEYLKAQEADRTWLSFDVNYVEADIGCNNTWMLAAYLARTKRIVILHDDDVLTPGFGPVYENQIAPALADPDVGMATWHANFIFPDGSTSPCEEWKFGATGIKPSVELSFRLAQPGRCSMSPILAVFDRATVIEACKEAETILTPWPECLERPGMLLGTELVVYLRNADRKKSWFYVDQTLSRYGSHPDSGSIRASNEPGGIDRIIRGYDKARQMTLNGKPPPPPTPKLLIVTSRRSSNAQDESRRMSSARAARAFLYEQFDAVELTIPMRRLKRSLAEFPYVRDLFDLGVSHAMPEDIVVYCNDDIGFTIEAPARILAGIERGLGATACPRRRYDNPNAHPLVRSVKNCNLDGGIDVFAVTPAWWAVNREKMPDMIIAREWWDAILGFVIEEAAGEPPMKNGLPSPANWWASRAYTDDVCWHEPHDPAWFALRKIKSDPGSHNRALALEFVTARGNQWSMQVLRDLQAAAS